MPLFSPNSEDRGLSGGPPSRPETIKAVGFKEHVLSVVAFWKGVDKEPWSRDVSINLKGQVRYLLFLAEALMEIVGQVSPRQWAEDKQGKNT